MSDHAGGLTPNISPCAIVKTDCLGKDVQGINNAGATQLSGEITLNHLTRRFIIFIK